MLNTHSMYRNCWDVPQHHNVCHGRRGRFCGQDLSRQRWPGGPLKQTRQVSGQARGRRAVPRYSTRNCVASSGTSPPQSPRAAATLAWRRSLLVRTAQPKATRKEEGRGKARGCPHRPPSGYVPCMINPFLDHDKAPAICSGCPDCDTVGHKGQKGCNRAFVIRF